MMSDSSRRTPPFGTRKPRIQSHAERAARGFAARGERDGAVRASATELHVVEKHELKLGKAHELAKVSRAVLRLGVL